MNKPNKIMFILLAVLLISFYSTAAFTAAYYIDYVNGSDSNSGKSASTAWKRCPGMKGFVGNYTHSAGDTFVFKGGVSWPAKVLPLTIKYGGTSGKPDTYVGGQRCRNSSALLCNDGVAWGNSYPIFDGEDTGHFQSGLIYQEGKNYITIDGIKIIRAGSIKDGSGMAILFGSASGITVKNCWLQPNGVDAFAWGANRGSYSALYFHDNIIKQAGRIHVGCNDASCDDFQFYNNTMYGSSDYNSHTYHTDGFMIGADGNGAYKATNLKIYNNKFLGDWSQSATALIYINGTPNKYRSWQNVYIYNNQLTIENNSGHALSPSLGIFIIECDNIKVYNNTIDGRALSSKSGHGIFFGDRNSNIDVQNNIIAGVDNAITFGPKTTGTITIGNNLFYGNTHLLWDGVHAKRYDHCDDIPSRHKGNYCSVSDPKFSALPRGGVAGSGNWLLQNNSPAVNKGTDLSAFFTTDILGNKRSGKWDIGAFKK